MSTCKSHVVINSLPFDVIISHVEINILIVNIYTGKLHFNIITCISRVDINFLRAHIIVSHVEINILHVNIMNLHVHVHIYKSHVNMNKSRMLS